MFEFIKAFRPWENVKTFVASQTLEQAKTVNSLPIRSFYDLLRFSVLFDVQIDIKTRTQPFTKPVKFPWPLPTLGTEQALSVK